MAYLRGVSNQLARATLFAFLLSAVPALRSQPLTKEDSLRLMNESIRQMFDTKGIEVAPSYSFQHRVRYDLFKHSWKGAKRDTIDLFFSDGSGVIAMGATVAEEGRSGRMLMVYDHPALVSLTFLDTDAEDMCMRMRIPDPYKGQAPAEVPFVRTGERRTIAGLEAEAWRADTGKETVTLWMAPMAGDTRPMMRAWAKMHGQRTVGEAGIAGLMLAGTLTRTGEAEPYARFEALEVRLNDPLVFSTAGYQVQ